MIAYRIYTTTMKEARGMVTAMGEENFIAVLNALVVSGVHVQEVRVGTAGTYVNYLEYITK